MTEARRPDPRRVLERISEDAGRGRLTVFLGYAAGVGKTYAMLEAAHEHARKGIDVCIGWLETHGRADTQSLAEGFAVVPPRQLDHRGVTLHEMDLDALLARHPVVALVDELAHTNAPGSRHTKRYQDVEELLAAGIHVFTTLNVQHIESLNDVVEQITGVAVRETVPDRIVDEAAEIRLTDLPPQELIHRLEEGKVYLPEQAGRALRRFFRAGNLNALRELALRKTTERVGGQLDTYMRHHEIDGPWPVRENVAVCIGPSPFSANLVRTARRIAAQNRSNWIAVTVEQTSRPPLDATAKERLAANARLAEELGADVVHLVGDDIAEILAQFVREHNVTQIIIGKPLRSRLCELWRGSLHERLIRRCPGVDIHVIPGEPSPQQKRLRIFPALRPKSLLRSYGEALAGVVVLTIVVGALARRLAVLDLNLLYLLPVIAAAVRWGRGPAIAAAAAGLLCIDFFFVPPFGTLAIADPGHVFTLGVFLAVGIVISSLAARLRSETEAAQTREARTAALYRLSRIFVVVEDLHSLLGMVAEEVSETFAGRAAVLLPDEGGRIQLQPSAGNEPLADPAGDTSPTFDEGEIATATWVFQHGQAAGRGTDTLAGASALYIPLQATRGTVGVLALQRPSPESLVLPEEMRMLKAFAALVAIAIERLRLAEEARRADVLANTEKLHLALLDSVSHDLRTPLAAILGSATSMLDDELLYDDATRHGLLETIRDEAARIENLLADLAANRQWARRFLDGIIRRNLVMLENILACPAVDGVLLGSDWGSQMDLLMSPAVWDELIRPGEQAEYDLIKRHGKHVWIHSCGNILRIIPALVEMGVDVLNPVQPECMDIALLKREFGRDLTFWGGLSTQRTLPFGTPEEVRREAREVRAILGAGGGLVFAPAQELQADVPFANVEALLEVAREKAV